MGIDQNEARRQRAADKPKRTVHPYVGIEHRIIDSPAYADLGFAARNLLVLLARQLNRDNNGHLQATWSWMRRYGFGSDNTLRAALSEVIEHGFVFKTRSHGANGAWARYALTWITIRKRDGLYLDTYRPDAWKDWKPMQSGFSTPQKLRDTSRNNCVFTPEIHAETAGIPPSKTAHYETCCHVYTDAEQSAEKGFPTTTKGLSTRPSVQPVRHDWIPAYLAGLSARGLAGRQCFQIPQGVTLQ